MNILVVDDDREIVESITIFLSGENYNVLKAYDGIEALDVLSENEIHLMILDIMMPKMPNSKKNSFRLTQQRFMTGHIRFFVSKKFTSF